VASGLAVMALGSDTGGSIRQPAALCGIVGMKPTYGRVSRYGLIAFASSLDQIGPLTRDVRDAALLMNVIAGHDGRDSTSVETPVPDYTKALSKEIKGMKIGIPKEYFVGGIDPEVEKIVKEAIHCLEKLGAKVEPISLPNTEHAISVYYIVAPSEASSNLARFDGVQYGYRNQRTAYSVQRSEGQEPLRQMYFSTRGEGFGKEAKRRIILGTYALSSGYYDAYYLKAQKVRTLIKNDFDRAFENYDCIVTPTSPTPAFKIGEKTSNPLQMYLSDIYTISANLAGIPAMSVPCGFTKQGLPVGLQLLAKPFAEETLFHAGYAYEQQNEWYKRRPDL
jgi:aspartyl-tRNA(Asn)/glutamyl-tRNA(Gln) amidotransferase subunit A